MKKLLNWCVIALMMVAIMPLASCDDDDNKGGFEQVAINGEKLIGTWEVGDLYKTVEKAAIDLTAGLPTVKEITFATGNALTITTADGTTEGTYSLNGDKLSLNAGNINATYTVKFRGADVNTICISYDTKGILGATQEDPGTEVDVTVTIHYSRVITAAE